MPALVREGYTSYKLYMTYAGLQLTDRQVLDVLTVMRREQAIAMVHAENTEFIEWLTERLVDKGLTTPKYHTRAHPVIGEREATHRAMSMSELVGVPIVLVHVSAREVVEQIDWARARGLAIHAETCPQYLLLTEDAYDVEGFEGAKFICTPPPRTADDQAAIWAALKRDVFDIVSSDHSPFRYADPKGKQIAGTSAGFHKVPNGVPGVETRMPLLFSEGVLKGRIDVNQFVRMTSTNVAKLYGLYPRKGTIAIGADADLVIWDTETPVTVTNDRLHHDCDYTPYEGMTLRAWPAITLSRGRAGVARRRALRGGRLTARSSPASAPPSHARRARPASRNSFSRRRFGRAGRPLRASSQACPESSGRHSCIPSQSASAARCWRNVAEVDACGRASLTRAEAASYASVGIGPTRNNDSHLAARAIREELR